MLEIPDIGEADAFFIFMDGLKPWAKLELQRRGVQELSQALSVAESLVEFSHGDKEDSSKPKNKGRGDRENLTRETPNKVLNDKGKKQYEETSRPREPMKCFFCDGPHKARECPKRGS